MSELSEHVSENRRMWDENAHRWVEAGERNWVATEPSWGAWGVTDLPMLPADMSGMDAIELGCGTGYVSAWMARRGAAVVGIDNSEQQLATARRLADEHRLSITWIHGNAENVPRGDASFDFATSEYGAALWCDPYLWIPEAYRLLRPGGELTFLTVSTLAALCMPADGTDITRALARPTFGLHRIDWRQAENDPGGIEFNLPTSKWFRLFRDTGFDVLDFVEVRAPAPSAETRFFVPGAWAYDHPHEQVWRLRKMTG